jgi:hypothetical protein
VGRHEEGMLDQAGAIELAKLLEAVAQDAELRDAFVSNPAEAAVQAPEVDAERLGSALAILESHTPEQRSCIVELNAKWPLTLEVDLGSGVMLRMPF